MFATAAGRAGSDAGVVCCTIVARAWKLSMLPSVKTSRWPFTAPSVPASTFSATHGVRNPLIRNFIPVKVKSGAGVTLIWHWLHVNPVCRTNAGTRASATCATTPSAANTTATLSHRMVCLLTSG